MSTPLAAAVIGPAVPASVPVRLVLTDEEVSAIGALLGQLTRRHATSESPAFIEEADVVAHELPRRIRDAIRGFRLHEPPSALCVVSGWPIDQRKAGPTPPHWKQKSPANRTLEEEMLLVLLGSLLGDLIGWSTQQDGALVHDILPIKEHEHEQLGSGSEQVLWWHVEDAFHPYRGDYIGLMCLRNPDRVPTTFATMAWTGLSPEHIRLLMEPHFTIRPDESHCPKNRGAAPTNGFVERAYQKIERMRTAPEKIPLLFGDPQAPYLRLDPYFMSPVESHPEAQAALDALVARIDAALQDLVLEPGGIYFIDNYQGVHGRRSFRARFDGTDRWLKRINVSRDLRKSRDARQSAASRLLY
jgi:Fe(II)/alpha-ketoglutarate-dependent arginine beta-hydroxylase